MSPKDSTGTERVLADFTGSWCVERTILHADGTEARFDGQSRWTPEGTALRYREEGALHLAGHAPIASSREDVWRADLTVWFADGRFFHAVPPLGGAVLHDCPPDLYRGWYDFAAWPRFTTRWQVNGPRKDYVMSTVYTPD